MRQRFTRLIAPLDWGAIVAGLVTGAGVILISIAGMENGANIREVTDAGMFVTFLSSAICGITRHKSEFACILGFIIPFCTLLVLAHVNGVFISEMAPRIAYSAIVAVTCASALGAKCGSLLKLLANRNQ